MTSPTIVPLLLLLLFSPLLCADESDLQTPEERAAAQAAQTPPVEIRIHGVDDDAMLENILLSLTLERQKAHPLLSDDRIAILYRRGLREIPTALIPFGYYRPKVSGTLFREDIDTDSQQWIAEYQVDPGTPVVYRDVEIRIDGPGSRDEKFTEWRENVPLKPGDPVLHSDYETAKSALLQLAGERGYLDARLLESRVRVEPDKGIARLRMHMVTGERYHFGPVTFSPSPLRESFLQRFVPFTPGDPYNASQLLAFQRTLTDSDYFERITLEQQRNAKLGLQVPMHVDLKARKPTRYSIGLGYGTDTGPRASFGAERRYANSRGHQLGVQSTLSAIRTELYTYYHIPLKNPVTDRVTLSTGYTEERTDTSSNYKRTLSISTVHQINAWQRIISLTHERESYDIAGQQDRTDLLIPGMTWQRIEADNRLLTANGWLLRLDLKATSEDLLSDVSFAQYQVTAKQIHSFSSGRRRIVRSEIGSTLVSDLNELPVSHRFFAGGDRSVRGFDYNSLGPLNDQGGVVGGRHLMVTSVEFEQPLKGKLAAALFYDVGNALNTTSNLILYEGAGFGLRWKLPFGTIRLDLAWPVHERPATPHLHLGLGPDL